MSFPSSSYPYNPQRGQPPLNTFTKTQEYEKQFSQKPNEILSYKHQVISKTEWDSLSQKLSNISTLIFEGISIDSYGLNKLSSIIESNPQIKNLILIFGDFSTHSSSFETLCRAIAKSSLIYLSLNNNLINSSLCSSIADMISQTKTLKFLDLGWNMIGNDGAKLIKNALTRNNSIIELKLIGTKTISADILQDIYGYMSNNKVYPSNYDNNYNNLSNRSNRSNIPLSNINMNHNTNNNNINNIPPLQIIEREKKLSDEYKSRYETQVLHNAKLQKEITELQKNLDNQRSRVEEMKREFDENIALEQTNRHKAEEALNEAKMKLSQLRIRENELQNELKETKEAREQENKTYEHKLNSLNDTLKRKNKEHEERYTSLKLEHEKNSSLLKNALQRLAYDNDEKTKDSENQSKATITALEKRVQELQNELHSMKEKNNALSKQLEEERRKKSEERNALEEKYKLREEKLMRDEQEKAEITKQSYDATKHQLENENKLLKEQIIKLNGNNNNNIKRNAKNKDNINENELNDKLNKLEIEKTQLEREKTTLEAKHASDINTIKMKELEIEKLKKQITSYNESQKQNEKKVDEYKNKKDKEMKKEKEMLINDKKNLQERIKELEKENTTLHQKVKTIETNIPKIRDNIKERLNSYIDSY